MNLAAVANRQRSLAGLWIERRMIDVCIGGAGSFDGRIEARRAHAGAIGVDALSTLHQEFGYRIIEKLRNFLV
jgi:hypothetical protein